MIKKFFTILLLVSFFGVIQAQNNVDFEFDFARFKYDTSTVYLELYYSCGTKNLTQLSRNDSVYVESILHVVISESATEELFVDKKYKIGSEVNTSNSVNTLIGVVGYRLPVGIYTLNLSIADVGDSLNRKEYTEQLNLKSFGTQKSSVSDIQLASRIITQSSNSSSIFYKNTLEVFPHPVNIFGQNYPMIFFYAEIYNLLSDTSATDLILNQQVVNSYGTKVFEKTKKLDSNNDSIVEIGAVRVTKFPTGSYILTLNLISEKTTKGFASAKKFYIYNPGVEDTFTVAKMNFDLMRSEFGVYSVEECDEFFESCEYVATANEIDRYYELNRVEAKREFLFNFWNARDMNPQTSKNEFKAEYTERINYVKVRYKTFSRKGIKTDRGRVYLIYGEPDETDLHPNDYDKKPHEIWYYHGIEGGVIFVFGDITGYSDYELLHSTKRGELRDDNWVRRISTN